MTYCNYYINNTPDPNPKFFALTYCKFNTNKAVEPRRAAGRSPLLALAEQAEEGSLKKPI